MICFAPGAEQVPRSVKKYQSYNKALYQSRECFVWGRRSSGYLSLRLQDEAKVTDSIKYVQLTLVEQSASYLVEMVDVPIGQKNTLCR